MSAQRVATGVALGALTALFLGVGLPSLLPPPPVPEIVLPAAEVEPARPPERFAPPAGEDDDPDDSADPDGTGDPDDSGFGLGDSPDSPDDSP